MGSVFILVPLTPLTSFSETTAAASANDTPSANVQCSTVPKICSPSNAASSTPRPIMSDTAAVVVDAGVHPWVGWNLPVQPSLETTELVRCRA